MNRLRMKQLATLVVAIATASHAVAPGLGPAETAAPFKGREVTKLVVRGVPSDLADPLLEGLALRRTSSLVGSKTRAVLFPRVLVEDVARVRLFLARRGHPRARIETFARAKGTNGVEITLDVRLGPPVLVRTIEVQGVPENLTPRARERVSLAPGTIFTDEGLERSRSALQSLLEREAYAFASVGGSVSAFDSSSVDVVLTADAGPRCRFGRVHVTGTRPDLVGLVERTVGVEPGDLYAPEILTRAQTRLRLLGLFRQIRVEIERTDSDGVIDLTIVLADRAPRLLEVGAGFWSDELLRVQLRWQHRNLLGGGRGFRASAFASTIRQRLETDVWWPAVLASSVRLEVGALAEHRREESYELLLLRGGIGGRYQPSFRSSYRIGLELSQADIEILTDDPAEFQETRGRVTSAVARYAYEGADDRLNPRRGAVARARVEQTLPGALSEIHFFRVELSSTFYVPVSVVTLAARSGGGWATPLGDSQDLLPQTRFLAGGASSMRGFRRNQLGPVDSDGKPVGGGAKLEAGLELRVPVVGPLALAGFVDTGQVWASENEIALEEIEVALGGGVMFITPIGPVRLDAGHRITDVIPGEGDLAVHLSIGHPF